MYRFVRIYKEQTPYRFTMDAPVDEFFFMIDYNAVEKCFTVALFKDGAPLSLGEPIRYGVPLFQDVMDYRFPGLMIVPWDVSMESAHEGVSWDNLNNAVKLYVFETAEDINTIYTHIQIAAEATKNIGQ